MRLLSTVLVLGAGCTFHFGTLGPGPEGSADLSMAMANDLAAADLTGGQQDLTGADLSDVDLNETDLAPFDIAGADLVCVPSGADDPDSQNVDSNCDGIDGDISKAVFVAPTGVDQAGGGTLASPFKTVAYAAAQLAILGKSHIYMAA